MNFKKYHVSRNLFDESTIEVGGLSQSTGEETTDSNRRRSGFIPVLPSTQYTISRPRTSTTSYMWILKYQDDKTYIGVVGSVGDSFTFVTGTGTYFLRWYTTQSYDYTNVMLNSGSTPLPYEPYGNTWHDTSHYIHKTSTDTITTLPADIYPNDTTATVGLKGNMQQTGTPTPQNPVMPEGCGGWDNEPAGINKLSQREYTDADGVSNESSTNPSTIKITYANKTTVPAIPSDVSSESEYQQWFTARTTYVGDDRKDYTADDRPCDYEHCQFFGNLKAGSYKLVCEAYVDTDRYPWVLRTHDNQNPYIALLTEDNQILVKKSMNQPYAPTVDDPLFNGYYTSATKFYHEEYPFTVSADTSVGFISKIYPQYNGNVFTRFQIVSSDVEAKPFTNTTYNISGVTCWEPYKDPPGYKLDISSASTTTPVYLGKVETTRKIGKIDLGTLNWSKTGSGNFWADTSISNCRIIGNSPMGNAICTHLTEVSANNVANTPYSFSSCLNTQARPFVNKTGFENMSGTEFKEAMSGVYMYYVLATPKTGIVNEPLMRIGDYADEVANVSIPVTAGANTLSVDTTVQPSEVTVDYKGWHPVQNVHERDNGAWT